MKIKDNVFIIIVLGIFLLLSLLLIDFGNLWWDSAVYIGMGKYLFSNGQIGLWEPIRPLALPVILGFFWKIGLNPLIAGEIFIVFLSVGVIILVYILSRKIFDKNTAILACMLASFSSLMLGMSGQILVEIPAVFLLLLGFYFYLEKKEFLSGLMFGLAFLTKFPSALFLVILAAVEILHSLNKQKFILFFKKYLYVGFGFLIISVPYFIFNYFAYHDFLFPLKSAQHVIDNVVGCNILNKQPFYYYFPLFIKDSFLYLFFIVGFVAAFSGRNKINRLQISFYVLAFLAYFSNLSCKTDRYPILALPFVAMISAYGIMRVFRKINKKYLKIGLTIIFIISLSLALNYAFRAVNNRQQSSNDFYTYLEGKTAVGEVLTTTPFISINSDSKLNLVYYPLYNSSRIDYYSKYVIKNKPQISYVFINTEDIPCNPSDLECPKKTIQFIKILRDNFRLVYYNKLGDGEYFIFSQ